MKSIFEESELMKLNEHIGEVIRIHGSIYKIRRMSGFCFVILRIPYNASATGRS